MLMMISDNVETLVGAIYKAPVSELESEVDNNE